MRKIIISVSNDIVTDQRIMKIAGTLLKSGADITIAGRILKDTIVVKDFPFKMKRFRLLFNKGPLFYASLNLRLFFYLLFSKLDLLVANDLDTLLANYLISKIKGKTLVYDTHELFEELPELVNRKRVRNIWMKIERNILPKLVFTYTVNQSIADIYREKYKVEMDVVRNVHYRSEAKGNVSLPEDCKDKNILLYAGVLNMGRGVDLVIRSLLYLDKWVFIILGYGYEMEKLKNLVKERNLEERVIFIGRVKSEDLIEYASLAHIGVSLEENKGMSYYYSLPNKIFTYIQAGTPVLGREFPEVIKIVKEYNIGCTTLCNDPEELAGMIRDMMMDRKRYETWKRNLKKAAEELCWEKESEKLITFYKKAGLTFP